MILIGLKPSRLERPIVKTIKPPNIAPKTLHMSIKNGRRIKANVNANANEAPEFKPIKLGSASPF